LNFFLGLVIQQTFELPSMKPYEKNVEVQKIVSTHKYELQGAG
jgi:hypothetical protein